MTQSTNQLLAEATSTSSVAAPSIQQPTRLSPDVVANQAGALRIDVDRMSNNVAEIHSESLQIQVEARTDEAAKRSPGELLTELSEMGFSWTHIARLVGVSIPAIRKWRQGESVSGQNRRSVARVVALVGVLEKDHIINDVPSWLEMPLAGSRFTGLDVVEHGRMADLLEFAANHISGSDLLDRAVPSWRSDRDERFEVFEAGDGERAIRLRTETSTE
jgi:hypothetical protein